MQSTDSQWFVSQARCENIRLRLFCFPYAGGGPSVFRDWGNSLPEDIELVAVRLPGRDNRIREQAFTEWPPLLDALENALSHYLDIPFAFYGHSFGARIAFELTKRLHAKNLLLPTQIFVSGCRCPHIPSPQPLLHSLPEAEFLDQVLKMNGTPPEVLRNKKLMGILEPTLRADMRLSELWGDEKQKINVPIVAFCGLGDNIDPPSSMREWGQYTYRKFSFYTFLGDHFFLHAQEKKLLDLMTAIIQQQLNDKSTMSFSLSLNQQAHWHAEQNTPGSIRHLIYSAVYLHQDINILKWKHAWLQIGKRHYSLRTTYTTFGGEPKQIIHSYPMIKLEVIEAKGWDHKLLQERFQKEVKKPFFFEQGPLLRVYLYIRTPEMPIQQIVMHKIVGDTNSLDILLNEFGFHYMTTSVTDEKKSILGSDSLFFIQQQSSFIAYTDFLNWQNELSTSKKGDYHLDFWREQLNGASTHLTLPTENVIDNTEPCYESYVLKLNKNHINHLKYMANTQKTSIFNVMLATLQVLLFRYTGKENFIIGSLMSGRLDWIEFQNVVGAFANEVILRANLKENPCFRELLSRVKQNISQVQMHKMYPPSLLTRSFSCEANKSGIQVSFSWDNYSCHSKKLFFSKNKIKDDFNVLEKPYKLVSRQGAWGDISIVVIEANEHIVMDWQYELNNHNVNTIKRMAKHYTNLLENIGNTAQKISEIPFLNDREIHNLLVDWNNTNVPYPDEQTITQLFEWQVKNAPNATALFYKGEKLTYNELNSQANQLAYFLIDQGVTPNTLVGICIDRSFDMVVGILAILKAGGAYLPIDITYPNERIALMLVDAHVSIVVTKNSFISEWASENIKIIFLDDNQRAINKESEENPPSAAKIDDLAYVNYTSGSTGCPKGVAIRHRGVVRLLFGANYAHLDSSNVFLQLAPISFDAATFELWGALLHGGKCILFEEKLPTIKNMSAHFEKYHVNILFLTTALFNIIIDEKPKILFSIKQVLTGGEAHSVKHMRKAIKELPCTEIISVYGPTESTTFATYYPVRNLNKLALSVPIGRPISNTKVYVLDVHKQLLPVGVIGELYIGGAGLARDYLYQPGLTEKSFVKNISFLPAETCLYKTGDLVKYLSDGNLDFIGRVDEQVKINGFRIEPGEIETVLMAHPQVKQAAIVVQITPHAEKKLVAFMISDVEKPKNEVLRSYLQKKLPHYMIPSTFYWLNSFPLTQNGKINRKELVHKLNNARELETQL